MDGSGIAAAASTMASLLAIFMVLAAAAFGLRRWQGRLPHGIVKMQGSINIIATRPLGAQQSLVIAEAEGCRFLIGVGRTGVVAIGRLKADD